MRSRTTPGATLAVAASRRDAGGNCKENRCRCQRRRVTSGASARTRSAGRCVTSARPTVLMVARAVFRGCSSVTIARRPSMPAPCKRDGAHVSRQRRTARNVSQGFIRCAEPIAANAVRREPTTVAAGARAADLAVSALTPCHLRRQATKPGRRGDLRHPPGAGAHVPVKKGHTPFPRNACGQSSHSTSFLVARQDRSRNALRPWIYVPNSRVGAANMLGMRQRRSMDTRLGKRASRGRARTWERPAQGPHPAAPANAFWFPGATGMFVS